MKDISASCTEITEEKAKEIWNDVSIFAFDMVNECEWQINSQHETRDVAIVLKEAMDYDLILFIENKWKKEN